MVALHPFREAAVLAIAVLGKAGAAALSDIERAAAVGAAVRIVAVEWLVPLVLSRDRLARVVAAWGGGVRQKNTIGTRSEYRSRSYSTCRIYSMLLCIR